MYVTNRWCFRQWRFLVYGQLIVQDTGTTLAAATGPALHTVEINAKSKVGAELVLMFPAWEFIDSGSLFCGIIS